MLEVNNPECDEDGEAESETKREPVAEPVREIDAVVVCDIVIDCVAVAIGDRDIEEVCVGEIDALAVGESLCESV